MKNRHTRQRIAVAVAGLLLGLAAPGGRAAVTITGAWGIDPFEPGPLNGPNLSRPGSKLWLGTGGDASFSALAGSVVDLYTLTLAASPGSNVTGVLDGAGTTLVLRGNGDTNRLEVGNTGNGILTVSGGALVDGRAEGWHCLEGQGWCNNFIGNAAGSTGQLTVTGAGSEVRMQNGFFIASVNLGVGWGTVGATTTGRVEVLNGGRMLTDSLFAGNSWTNNLGNGQERSLAFVTVAGANSVWEVAGLTLGTGDSLITLAQGALATTQTTVNGGGVLRAKATSGNAVLRMGDGGGHATTALDHGRIELISPSQSFAGIGLGGGQGNLQMDQSVLQMQSNRADLQVGAVGGQGRLQARGGQILLNATADSAIGVGIEGGQGELALSNGATLAMTGSNSRYVVIGRGAGGNGVLTLDGGASFSAGNLSIADMNGSLGRVTVNGAGTVLQLDRTESDRLTIGNWGDGALTVSGGGLLDTTANAAACAGHWCGVIVGHMAGATARLTVTGAGSEARLLGQMQVGATQRFDPAHGGFDGGTPGGTTHARVEVLAGGKLVNEWVDVGGWQPGPVNLNEQSFADVVVAGAGSTWRVVGSALGGNDANLNFGSQQRSTTTLDISGGGLVSIEAPAGRNGGLYLSTGQGRSSVTLRDAGSQIAVKGDSANVSVGAWNTQPGGDATLIVKDGAHLTQDGVNWSQLNIGELNSRGVMEIRSGGQVSGARNVSVGAGGQGSLLISGAGSLLTTDRNGSFVGQLNVGQTGTGRLDVLDGGAASVFSLQVGTNGGRGQVVIDGAGSKVEMDAVDWHRMAINGGSITVSGGALLDGTVNAAACTGHWCGVFIANNAGDDGVFTVTGNGSKARFLSNFNVGQAYVTAPPATPWTLGEPGGTSFAQVNVLAGGRLETQQVNIASGPSGPNADGSESVIAQLRIKGAGSVWSVTGGSGSPASFSSGVGNAANTLTDIQVADGGQLQLSADVNTAAFVQLGAAGSISRMSITGAGSKLAYSNTNNAGFWVGRNGATASLSLAGGGAIEGINRLQIANTGATGSLSVKGSGSRIDFGSAFADLYVGRQGGSGSAAITQGGVVNMAAALPRLYVGSGDGLAGTSGALRIDGAGSLVSLVSPQSLAGAFDLPQANIGWGGVGTVDITGGGQLLLNGRGTSTPSQIATTRLTIGQFITGVNGSGTVNVGGAGSKLSVKGTDPVVYVGRLAGGSGALNLTNGAALETTLLDVGLQGGIGALQMNASSLDLSGQHAGSHVGATLGIGLGTGSLGSASITNGSTVNIHNNGSEGALLLLGGANSAPGGNGSLVVRGSNVQISGPSNATAAVIGYNGSGQASFENGSTLDLGATGSVVVGWQPGSTGLLKLSGGSALTAHYVGVSATSSGDGGAAALIVNDTSTVTASTIEIGSKGYVGGTGTLVGDIINRGIFSPGNSPGTLHLQGSFANQSGGRLVLEVESDGHGGFITDQLVFDAASAVSLGGVQIEFRFLGTTDPNAFQASGAFQIDSFLRQGNGGLDHSLLGSASYSASSPAYQFTSFSFSANGGAVFQAQAVPEPGGWAMLLAGLLGMGWITRRRERRA